jgi:SMC interacting uncharacterized protein involved in chromosome segregation
METAQENKEVVQSKSSIELKALVSELSKLQGEHLQLRLESQRKIGSLELQLLQTKEQLSLSQSTLERENTAKEEISKQLEQMQIKVSQLETELVEKEREIESVLEGLEENDLIARVSDLTSERDALKSKLGR